MSVEDHEGDIFDQAALFFEEMRTMDGVKSPQLIAWLNADPAHHEAFDEVVRNWQLFDDHRADPEVLRLAAEGLADAYETGARPWQVKPAPSRRYVAAGLAAAAVGTVGLSSWFLTRPKIADFSTGVGEQRSATLADETKVLLDANTRLSAQFHAHHRDVRLAAGRAYFEVAKDESRPFRVTVGRELVTAVGTAFTVEERGGVSTVVLLEGRVKVSQEGGANGLQWMTPGQKLITFADGSRKLLAVADMAEASAWQMGKLVFDNDTLADAVDRMNDYSSVKLRVAGQDAQNLRISGTFIAGKVEPFLDALQTVYPVKTRSVGEQIEISKR